MKAAWVLLAALVSAGCVGPGTSSASLVAPAGELVQPAEVLELPPQAVVHEDLEPWRSLRLQNVLLADQDEAGWNQIQFELQAASWRKPFLLEDRPLTLETEGTAHVARLDWGGGFHAYPVPDGWGRDDVLSYDNASRSVPPGGLAVVSWKLPTVLAAGQEFTLRIASADFEATVPEDATLQARPLGVILGGDVDFAPFTAPTNEFWEFEEVVAHRDGDRVTRIEVTFTVGMEQDLSDAWIGVLPNGTSAPDMEGATWFIPGVSPPGHYAWATSNDTDLSLQEDPAWVTPGDRIHAWLDLESAGVALYLGGSVTLDIGPDLQPRLDRIVPIVADWDGASHRVLYERSVTEPADGEVEGGGGSG